MSLARTLGQIARADFLERVRRHGFLVTLGLAIVAGVLFLPPNHARYATLQFDGHRGIYNSAWVGTLVSMMTTTFLALAGFYVVKNAIERDRRSGVGVILAATPLSRWRYVMGKALSNFAVLAAMVGVIAVAAGVVQRVRGEDTRLDLLQLLGPFVFLTLPAMAVVAALAVLFEVLPFLRGGFGNVGYFFLWIAMMTAPVARREGHDPAGLRLVLPRMAEGVHRAFPGYDAASGNLSMGVNFHSGSAEWNLQTFQWEGMTWSAPVLLDRVLWLALALGITVVSALAFDRFDTVAARPRSARARWPWTRVSGTATESESSEAGAWLESVEHLTPLSSAPRPGILRLARAEFRLMHRGAPTAWKLVALGLVAGGLFAPLAHVRHAWLPIAWIWPVLVWSALGNREHRYGTGEIVFATPQPVWRPIVAQWLAGFAFAALATGGAGAHFALAGETASFAAWLAGAAFVPALAVALGVSSGSGKLFEVLYVMLWYVGPMSGASALDFTGGSARPAALPWLGCAAVLVALALAARARRLAS